MPGFFDKVSKGLGDLADNLNKAVSSPGTAPSDASGGTGAPVPPPPGAAPPPPAPGTASAPSGTEAGAFPASSLSADDALDGTDPASWTTPGRLADVVAYHVGTSLVFGEVQSFDRGDAAVARFVGADGAVTVDLVSYTEDTMAAAGTRDALLAQCLDGVGDRVDEPVPEIAVSGTSGPGHACCVDLAGDAALRVDVYAPAEIGVAFLRAVAVRVVRDALRLP